MPTPDRIAGLLVLLSSLSAVDTLAAPVTTVRITGSTAFRQIAFNALTDRFFDTRPKIVPANATAGSSQVTFIGTKSSIFGDQQVVVETAYSGSVEGLVNILDSAIATPVAQPSFLLPDGSPDSVDAADFAFSDVAQEDTPISPAMFGAAIDFQASPNIYPGSGVGVVTFAFVKNNGYGTNELRNITQSQFQALAASGHMPVSFFTENGGTADPVYLAGRYAFSGTRLSINIKTGLDSQAPHVLYAGNGDNTTFTSGTQMVIVPTWRYNSRYYDGFVSGGSVAALLNNFQMNDRVVSYLGLGDVRTAKPSLRDFVVSYNGVFPARSEVMSGRYSLWSFEHIYGRAVRASGEAARFMNGSMPNVDALFNNGFINALDGILRTDPDYVSLLQMDPSVYPPISQPSIRASLAGGHVELTWPVTAVGFQLQSAPILGDTNAWNPVVVPPVTVNGLLKVTADASPASQYFRLIHP